MADSTPLAVGWDLDSTLASTMHRRYLVPMIKAGKATWDDYSALCVNDEPVPGAVELARTLRDAGHPQYAISGRSDRAFGLTWAWLIRHDVPMDHVILRPEGDCTDTKLFKVAKIKERRAQGVRFRFFVEDWAPIAKYITEQTGIPVLGVNPFDEGSVLVTQDQLAVALDDLDAGVLDRCADFGDSAGLAAEIFPRLGGAF